MIRRGFWLATGVVLGVTGYRRLTRLATELTVQRPPTAGPQMLAPPKRANSSYVARAVAAAKFARDVRDGMADYRDMHRDEPDRARQGRTLEVQSVPAQSADPAESGASQQGRREP
jgi:hypothetical protein